MPSAPDRLIEPAQRPWSPFSSTDHAFESPSISFNMQSNNFQRRVNTFIYLNPEWDSDAWNGDLELWDRSMSKCAAKIAPIDNRLAVFSTTDFSYHGHADALTCPPDRSRRSIAMYYYTADRPLHEVVLGADGKPKPHSTLYQTRRCGSCNACRLSPPPPPPPPSPPPPKRNLLQRLLHWPR